MPVDRSFRRKPEYYTFNRKIQQGAVRGVERRIAKSTPLLAYPRKFVGERANFSGDTIDLHDFVGGYLPYTVFENIEIRNCDLRKCNFTACVFRNVEFVNVDLSDSIMEGAFFEDVLFKGVNFSNSMAGLTQFSRCKFDNSILKNCYWPYSTFREAGLVNTSLLNTCLDLGLWDKTRFQECQINSSSFAGVKLGRLSWLKSNLNGNIFHASTFLDCRFSETSLTENIFKGNFYLDNQAARSLFRGNVLETNGIDEKEMFAVGFTRWISAGHRSAIPGITAMVDDPPVGFYGMETDLAAELFDHVEKYVTTILATLMYSATVAVLLSAVNSVANAITEFGRQVRSSVASSNLNFGAQLSSDSIARIQWSHSGEFRGLTISSIQAFVATALAGAMQNHASIGRNPASDMVDSTELVNTLRVTFSEQDWGLLHMSAVHRLFNNYTIDSTVRQVMMRQTDTNNFVAAAHAVFRNQSRILNAADGILPKLTPTSTYRVNSMAHIRGAVDFSLKGFESEQEMFTVAEKLTKKTAKSDLAVVERLYWVEEGVTVHSVNQSTLNNARGRNFRPPQSPPPSNIAHSDRTPDDGATVIQINTLFVNGAQSGSSRWSKPHASATHIHVQPRKPAEIPLAMRRFLSNWTNDWFSNETQWMSFFQRLRFKKYFRL